MRTRFSTGMYCSVRMLCSRSASLTTTMRQSSPIASSMFRWLSSFRSSAGSAAASPHSFDIFESPRTISITSGPK